MKDYAEYVNLVLEAEEFVSYLCQPTIWRMAAILSDSTVVVAVVGGVRTRPRAIPLAMRTMGFLQFSIWVWGSALQPFGPPELRYKLLSFKCQYLFLGCSGTAIKLQHISCRHAPRNWTAVSSYVP